MQGRAAGRAEIAQATKCQVLLVPGGVVHLAQQLTRGLQQGGDGVFAALAGGVDEGQGLGALGDRGSDQVALPQLRHGGGGLVGLQLLRQGVREALR